jgi:hypothetical protein
MPRSTPADSPDGIDPTLTITVSMRDLALVLDNFGFDDPYQDSEEAYERLTARLDEERIHRG